MKSTNDNAEPTQRAKRLALEACFSSLFTYFIMTADLRYMSDVSRVQQCGVCLHYERQVAELSAVYIDADCLKLAISIYNTPTPSVRHSSTTANCCKPAVNMCK